MHDHRAYIRQRGRLTAGQARALATLRTKYTTHVAEWQPPEAFGIEIGFGMGVELAAWARAAPDYALLGIELYEPGVGALLARLERENLANVRIIESPAQDVISALPGAATDEIRILFPDPWPKKRHHKRRLIQPDFVAELARVMRDSGVIKLATDWSPYADWMRQCFAAEPAFIKLRDDLNDSIASRGGSAPTKFENRGARLGHDIHDLVYERRVRASGSERSRDT